MVPQWLKLAFDVKRALGILLAFEESSGALIWNVAPYVVIRGQVTSPFSALPAQRIWPANETMSYDLKYMNHEMEEKGIVAGIVFRFPLPAAEGPSPRRCPMPAAGDGGA